MTENNFVAPPMSYILGGVFNPNDVDQERVVLLGLVVDGSGSTRKYEQEFNQKLQEFLAREQRSHIAEELFFQITNFSDDVVIDSGWQPVLGYDTNQTVFRNRGGLTAGFDGVQVSLESMLDYGKQLQKNGTDVRYNLVLVTDGDFNAGKGYYGDGNSKNGDNVRAILDKIRSDESLYGKFTIFMYGVGIDAEFEATCDLLTIDRTALLRTGATGNDFAKMLTTVSQSVSKSSSGTAVPNF